MSTRAEDRPGRSHVPPTPPAKLAPADDPAWAHTLALAALAREARPTTTNEETTMADTPAKGLEWIADRLDQLNANAVTMFEDIDERAGNGEDIDSDTDELRHQSVGASIAYGTAAQMVREALAPPTNKDDTRTLEWNGVTVTIGTSSGRDGAALVIIDTEGEPDGSDGSKGLRVDVNDGFTWRIDFADEAQQTHDERLTISVGRDTAKEARDALAWFQLGQSEPVTIDVEEGCLAVHLDDGILSIGVEGTEDATVWYKPHGEEPYEFGAVLPAGLGLDEEEQVEFHEIIDGLMGNLAGFHYLSGGAAVRAIVAEGRP